MATAPTIRMLPPNAPAVDLKTGRFTGEQWRYFNAQWRDVNAAASGSVTTAAGSGLQGGGIVADGISLSIAPNGVSNAMIRQGLPTSVIGRFQNSTGNVADIQAVVNGTVLTRQGDILAFTPTIDVTTVQTDNLRIDQTPTAEVVVCTHTIIISVDGTNYKIPIVAA